MSFVLDAYSARSCPVKTFNTFDPTATQPPTPLDESLAEQFQGGRERRKQVLDAVAAQCPGVVDLRGLEESGASWQEREEACLQALAEGVPAVIGAVLPVDLAGHRTGRADLLVRGDDTPVGTPGYWPVKVKSYLVREKQLKAEMLKFSTAQDIGALQALPGLRYRTRRELALLEVAHVWRLLEAAGFASRTQWGGVIGTDQNDPGLEGPVITWLDLGHRFIRTFSRTAATGYKLRSALERYDHEHGFRVHIAEQALKRTGEDDPEPPVRPIRIRECESCAWWEVCRPRMDDDDISLRLSKTPLDVRELQTLVSLGITTVTELAEADLEGILPDYLPLTAHRDRSEQRLRQAARRARMVARGVYLERVTEDPIGVPRSRVEVDLDIETTEGDVTYLWGLLVSDRGRNEQTFTHFSGFEDLTPAAEIELAARFCRWLLEMVDKHPDLLVFHYSDYETVHLRRLAERSGHPDLVAVLKLIPRHFVDLFLFVRDNFVGVEGLGLKTVAQQGPDFRWRDDEPGGLASQGWFATAVADPDPIARESARRRVLEYNEDDVRATWAVREWLETSPPAVG